MNIIEENNAICKEKILHRTAIVLRQHAIFLKKEFFRKSIHLCTLFVPFALHFFYWQVIFGLTFVLVFYCVAEIFRMHGKNVPIIYEITSAAARKRDENRFVLGPVTLCVGVLLTALIFDSTPASIGIFALAAGDGLASLIGKMFGKTKIPFTGGKSVVGSLSCFFVIFILAFAVLQNCKISFYVALLGMFVELLPLKDFDNLLIPVALAGLVQFLI